MSAASPRAPPPAQRRISHWWKSLPREWHQRAARISAWPLVHGYAVLCLETGLEDASHRAQRAEQFARLIDAGEREGDAQADVRRDPGGPS